MTTIARLVPCKRPATGRSSRTSSGLTRPARSAAQGGGWVQERARGFDVGHVHGVRNLGPDPATSIHVYSPALRGMGHYELGSGGVRRVQRSYDDGALEP